MAPEQVMEGMTEVKNPPRDDIAEITRSSRDLPPAHFTYKIENFTQFSSAEIDKVESGDFEVFSYKWRLCLYPDGNKKSNGDGHVSLYLVFSDSNALPFGWEVNVNFRLFIYNQINDKYLTIQYANGRTRRFHGLQTVLGFDHLLPLSIFKDVSKGYLIEDRCIFGAEIFVIKPTGKGECLSMVKEPVNSTFTWKIQNFSALDKKSLRSQVFSFGGHKWSLLVYPKGNSTEAGKSLSIFLAMEDSETLPSGRTTYALYMLRVRDQLFGKHFEKEANCHFSKSIKDWGHLNFMPLDDVNALPKGFLVKDTLVVEAQIHGITVAKEFS